MDPQDPSNTSGQSSSAVQIPESTANVPIAIQGYYGPPHQQSGYAPAPPLQQQQHPHSHLSYSYPSTAHAYGNRYVGSSVGGYDAGPSSLPIKLELERVSASPSRTASPGDGGPVMRRIGGKANVSSACAPCKKAHLACDVSRPCKRCVNMGKEALCADVPHKKRGRPKSVKPPLSEPYSRIRPPLEGGMRGWRSEGPPYEGSSYPYAYSADPPQSYPLSRSLTDPEMDSWSSPAPFTIFTTTEWKVLRVSPACYQFTGYHPHAFVNLNLLEWFMPSDRDAIEHDRERLVTPSPYSGPITSDREVSHALAQYSERDLLSPVEGMPEPYPNQNVRVLRSDHQYSLFNVRLHLGGGLGGSLYRPETMGRIYLVVSLLLISNHVDRERPPAGDDRRYADPPTPTTAMPASSSPAILPHSASAPSLPSFSSMAAAADGPPASRYEPSPVSGYYAAQPRAPPAGGYDYRGGPPSGYPRSPSPYSPHPAQRAVTGPGGMTINTTSAGMYGEYPAPTPTGSPYYDPRGAQNQGGEYRREDQQWDQHQRRIVSQPNLTPVLPSSVPGHSHSPTTATAIGAPISPAQPVQTPTTAQMPPSSNTPGSASQDYGRRTWEL